MKTNIGIIPILMIFLCSNPVFSQGVWTQKANLPGSNRSSFTGFSVGSKGYAGTGTYGGLYSFLADWYIFDPVANTWSSAASLPYGFKGCSGFAAGGFGFLVDGVNDMFYNQDTYQYNTTGNNWSVMAPFPANRIYATATGLDNKGYVTGGYDFGAQPMNDCWAYDQASNTWTQKASLPVSAARYDATSFAVGGKIYLFGGDTGGGYLNDLWEYDPVQNTWTNKKTLPGTARSSPVSFTVGSKAYVVGGWSASGGPALKEVWEYNPATDNWVRLQDFPGANGPVGGVGFTISGIGYIVCGTTSTETWAFNPGTTGIMVENGSEVVVSPNPATDKIFLHNLNIPKARLNVDVVSAEGRTVMTFQLDTNPSLDFIELNIHQLKPGVYFLRLNHPEVDSGVFVRFIKM